MKSDLDKYLEVHIDLIRKIEVYLVKKEPVSFSQGVDKMIDLLESVSKNRNKIMFVGNGGSAAVASHFALDYWHAAGIRSMDFFSGPQLTCLSNDHGYREVFSRPIEMFAEKGDVLAAISSSGESENILAACKKAGELGCKVVTLSGFKEENRLRDEGEINFYVPSKEYGHVESIHEFILHTVLDLTRLRR